MRPTLFRQPEQRLTARLASDDVVWGWTCESSSLGWDLFGERDDVADLAVELSSKNLDGSATVAMAGVVVVVVGGLMHGVMVSGTLNSVSSFLVILWAMWEKRKSFCCCCCCLKKRLRFEKKMWVGFCKGLVMRLRLVIAIWQCKLVMQIEYYGHYGDAYHNAFFWPTIQFYNFVHFF